MRCPSFERGHRYLCGTCKTLFIPDQDEQKAGRVICPNCNAIQETKDSVEGVIKK